MNDRLVSVVKRAVASRVAGAVACAALLLPLTANAAPPPSWKETAYTYDATGKSLAKVLSDFGDAMGARILIEKPLDPSPKSTGSRIAAPSAIDYLDRIAIDNGFSWYFYNNALHINPISDSVTERIEVRAETMGDAQHAMRSIGLLESRFGWGEMPEQGVVLVSGPTAYVARVRELLKSNDKPEGDTESQIMVFRLKHALAIDRTFTVRDQARTVPGISTILKSILDTEAQSSPNVRRSLPLTATPTGGLNTMLGALASSGTPPQNDALPDAGGSAKSQDRAARTTRSPAVVVSADARLNAVLIRDLPRRRAMYQSLVDELDVASPLIEITAYIIDVNKNDLSEWVPELGYRGQSGGAVLKATSSPDGSGHATAAGLVSQVASAAIGGNVALLTAGRFMLNLQALESRKMARVLSRPSVLTMDNSEAVIDLSRTSFIKLIGERNVDARAISAGLMFQVTPRVMASSRIHLIVNVEDGEIVDNGNGSSNPQVSRKAISTQAVLGENQVLVIGGYRHNDVSNNRSQVPILGDLPIVGKMFQHTGDSQADFERLYVLSARAIEPGQPDSEPAVLGANALDTLGPLPTLFPGRLR